MIGCNTTHDVHIDRVRGIVTKRFRSRSRGEPVREWAALTLLATFAPGLAPAPLTADLNADPATIKMSWLPGTRLSGAPLTSLQADGLASALVRLWRSVPSVRQRIPRTLASNPAALTNRVRMMLAAGCEFGDDPLVDRAYAAAASWVRSGDLDRHDHGDCALVLGQGDPNLANFLWDGDRVRLVDFEDSGPSDRAFELAILAEHMLAWSDASLDAGAFLGLFDLTRAEETRVHDFRRLAALFWLILLQPGSTASVRNPPGTLQRQASRLLALLG